MTAFTEPERIQSGRGLRVISRQSPQRLALGDLA
jgi:hypothetical protein